MSDLENKKKLLSDWCKHKKAENTAKKKRTEVEAEIEAMYGKFEGISKTFSEDELGFKVNVKKSLTTKLDQKMYKQIRLDIPETLRPEKITFGIDQKGIEWLKENNPEVYSLVSDCITETPGKTSVKVEKI